MQKARAILEFVAEVAERAHNDRQELWSCLPDHTPMILIPANDGRTNVIVMNVERKTARVVCTDFVLAERRTALPTAR